MSEPKDYSEMLSRIVGKTIKNYTVNWDDDTDFPFVDITFTDKTKVYNLFSNTGINWIGIDENGYEIEYPKEKERVK